MKGRRALERGYDRLEPWERFQLTLAAEARDDEHDAEELARTCPRRPYRICEPEFLDPLDLSLELAHGFAAEILPLAGRLDVAQVAIELGAVQFQVLIDEIEFTHVQHRAGRVVRRATCAKIREADERSNTFFEHLAETLLAAGALSAHGFAAFCEHELGVEPQTLLGAFARIALPSFKRFAAYPADPDQVANYHAELAGVWRYRLGQQAEPTPIARRT